MVVLLGKRSITCFLLAPLRLVIVDDGLVGFFPQCQDLLLLMVIIGSSMHK